MLPHKHYLGYYTSIFDHHLRVLENDGKDCTLATGSMPAIYKDSDAPGPLVKRSDLVPDVALGGNAKFGRFGDDANSPWAKVPIIVISFAGTLTYLSGVGQLWMFGCLFVAGVLGSVYWQHRGVLQMRKYIQNTVSQALIADSGDFRTLITQLEGQLADANAGTARIVALNDLGGYELRASNYDRALACLSECYRWTTLSNPSAKMLLDNIQDTLAAIYAIQGDLSSANAWLSPPPEKTVNPGRIITLVRAEKFEEALQQEFHKIADQHKVMVGHPMRVFALMKSFAQWNLDKSKMDEDELESARPVARAEYDYLCTYWPELAEFVSTLELKEQRAVGGIPVARVVSH